MSKYQTGLKEALKTPPDYARQGSASMRPSSRSLARTSPEHLPNAPNMTPPDERLQYARFVDPNDRLWLQHDRPQDRAAATSSMAGSKRLWRAERDPRPTGVSPYVMPTREMQGFYPNNAGELGDESLVTPPAPWCRSTSGRRQAGCRRRGRQPPR